MKAADVPIFYYHSVGNDYPHPWSFLSLSTITFEKQLKYLKKNGYKTYTLSELYNMAEMGIPDKSVVLTFDDGYLDNWVFVYPLLKKHGAKATFFVNPDFVDTSPDMRLTLEDVWKKSVLKDELPKWGYASWKELKKMSDEGIVDIQSHGMTHALYFSGEKIVDYHHPSDAYYWLEWNLRPQEKSFWLSDRFNDNMSYGYPVYEFATGFTTRRYFDDKKLANHLTKHVKEHGGLDFFKDDNWKNNLKSLCDEYIRNNTLCDHKETKDEYLSRINVELVESKSEIEKHIGKPVRFISWPNGAYNEEAHRMAVEDVGYTATVATVKSPTLKRADMLGRVAFGQGYLGPFRNTFYYLKFISAVESTAGTGFRHLLICLYQRTKISSLYHWFFRRFFEWR